MCPFSLRGRSVPASGEMPSVPLWHRGAAPPPAGGRGCCGRGPGARVIPPSRPFPGAPARRGTAGHPGVGLAFRGTASCRPGGGRGAVSAEATAGFGCCSVRPEGGRGGAPGPPPRCPRPWPFPESQPASPGAAGTHRRLGKSPEAEPTARAGTRSQADTQSPPPARPPANLARNPPVSHGHNGQWEAGVGEALGSRRWNPGNSPGVTVDPPKAEPGN